MSGLSRAEHKAMNLTAQLWNLMVKDVIEDGDAGEQDRREFAAQIHAIQHTIMGQAAARAHPDRYRLLGASLVKREPRLIGSGVCHCGDSMADHSSSNHGPVEMMMDENGNHVDTTTEDDK